jgi:hypothetical protein
MREIPPSLAFQMGTGGSRWIHSWVCHQETERERATMAVLFVVNCFVVGFVARTVAGYWEEEYDDDNGEMV